MHLIFSLPDVKQNTVRVRERFLLFPKSIDGRLRWLEKAKWKERYTAYSSDETMVMSWESIEWLD